MRKVIIIGNGGAGKSTLARQIGTMLNIQVTHLDSVYWKPQWQPISAAEMKQAQEQIVTQATWVIDGQFKHTLDVFLPASDTIIFLDFPLFLCLYRIIKRHFQYANKPRPELGEGYPEILTLNFIYRVLLYHLRTRHEVLKKITQYTQDRKVIILRTPQHVKRFLSDLQSVERYALLG